MGVVHEEASLTIAIGKKLEENHKTMKRFSTGQHESPDGVRQTESGLGEGKNRGRPLRRWLEPTAGAAGSGSRASWKRLLDVRELAVKEAVPSEFD